MSDFDSNDINAGGKTDPVTVDTTPPRESSDSTPSAETPSMPMPPPPPPGQVLPPKKSSGIGKMIAGLAIGGLLVTILFVVIAMFAFAGRGTTPMTLSRNKVGVILIQGEIFESATTISHLNDFADNRSIHAIVLRINSPGGAVAPSQEIYSEVLRVREETGKPVIASMGTVAASGGYYIAAACDEIIANPGSITGSIGVIAQWFNLEDLVEWARLRPETFKSGKLKDAGSPYREMTDDERAYYQRIISQLHEQFIGAVITGRDGRMSEDDVRTVADGRVFTGEEALELKLIDQLGGLQQALRVAADRAGLSGDPTPVYPRIEKRSLLDVLAESKQSSGFVEKFLVGHGSPFLYRW